MVRHGDWHYLITSRGDYGDCRYRTIWRRSAFRSQGWQGTRGHALLNRRNTGVCGPGGADYVTETDTAANRMFFHGWVCKGTNLPCYQSYQGHQDYEDVGKRALYAVRLRWTKDGPSIAAFVQGPVPPPPVTETPTPTPAPTETPRAPTEPPTGTPTPTPTPTGTPTPTPTGRRPPADRALAHLTTTDRALVHLTTAERALPRTSHPGHPGAVSEPHSLAAECGWSTSRRGASTPTRRPAVTAPQLLVQECG